MNPSNDRAETLFNSAAQLEPAVRASFLDHACAGNPVLRARVEELLGAAAAAGGFLPDQPQHRVRVEPQPTMPMEPGECLGEWVGRYKLLEKLGEGGCGVVYLAQQEEPVRRRVALKVIKLGMDTRQVVARFEAERQALALMDHPNIAKVLDGGTTDNGRPYFVMELVRGVRITDYCDEAQLNTPQRLELFAQVCLAVQHAHQKGIIHRDLKPSNILVTINDGEAVPKVIDFGIAKATSGQESTDKSAYTAFEQFIGTPAYMSPEQALMTSLDIDTRSDVYSLGVLLYELLTGRPPFDPRTLMASGIDAMRRTIREEEPMRPSTLAARELSTLGGGVRTPSSAPAPSAGGTTSGEQHRTHRQVRLQETIPLLRGDLDWIVMKCLEKDRRRRYDTAAGLAADIRRHLDNEPVAARPPSLGYRVQKTVRRHRSAFATAGVVLVALLFGLGISVWQAVQKSRALERMTEAEKAQSHSREVAEKALNQEAAARRRVDELLEQEKTARRASESRLYATDIHLAQQAIDKDNFGRARELLARHYPRPGETNRPGWEWRYLWQQLHDDAAFEVTRTSHNDELAVGSSTTPDPRWLVVGHQSEDRAWFDVLDITQLRALRNTGEIELPSANAISALAIGDRNGLIAHAQASRSVQVLGPGVLATIEIHDPVTRRTLATITNLPGLCMALAWSGDGQRLVSQTQVASPSGSTMKYQSRIDVWRAPDLTPVATLTNFPKASPNNARLAFAATTDASAVAVASRSYPLSVIDVASGATRWSFTSQNRGFDGVALSSDGHTVFALEDADPWVIRAFDFQTGGELCAPLKASVPGNLRGLVLSPDGRTLASISSKGFLCLWDVGDLTHGPKTLPPLRSPSVSGLLAVLPDGRTILTHSENGTVLAWDLARERAMQQPLKVTLTGSIAQYQLSADNRTLLLATRNGSVSQKHGPEFQSETPLFDLGRSLGQPTFSMDGRWFASGSTNGFVEVWNVQERRRVQQFGHYSGSVRAVQFSEDGSRLIVFDRENQRGVEWDWATPREVRTFPLLLSGKVPFERPGTLSPDGRQMLAETGSGTLTWMDTLSQQKRSGNVGSIFEGTPKFTPGGGKFSICGSDGYVHIHDCRTFEPIATLGDGTGSPTSLQYIDGGNQVFLGGFGLKSPVTLWDLSTQLELLRLEAEGDVDGLQLSRDGSVLTGYSRIESDKKFHLWSAPSWEEIERAEAALPSVSATRPR